MTYGKESYLNELVKKDNMLNKCLQDECVQIHSFESACILSHSAISETHRGVLAEVESLYAQVLQKLTGDDALLLTSLMKVQTKNAFMWCALGYDTGYVKALKRVRRDVKQLDRRETATWGRPMMCCNDNDFDDDDDFE